VPALLILGLGQGSAFTTMYAAASTGVAAEHQGIGSGIASTGQQLGNAVGLAYSLPSPTKAPLKACASRSWSAPEG